jgi:amino acid transporter
VTFLRSFGRFWYDFIIGDDWKIAVAVVLALSALLVANVLGVFGDAGLAIFGGIAVVVAFAISLAIDVRRS